MMKKTMAILTSAAMVLSMSTFSFAGETEAPADAAPISAAAGYDEANSMSWTVVTDSTENKVYIHQMWADKDADNGVGTAYYSGTMSSVATNDDGSMSVTFTDDEDGNDYTLDLAEGTDAGKFTGTAAIGDYKADMIQVDPTAANIEVGLTFYAGLDGAGNDVAIGYNQAMDTLYFCSYMAEDPATAVENQFTIDKVDQGDDNSLTFAISNSNGDSNTVKIAFNDELGLTSSVTIGEDDPFTAVYTDLTTFPAYAEAYNAAVGAAGTEASTEA